MRIRARSLSTVAAVSIVLSLVLGAWGPATAHEETGVPTATPAADGPAARTDLPPAVAPGAGAPLPSLPVRFEKNMGQAAPEVLFAANHGDESLLMLRDGLVAVRDGHAVQIVFVDARAEQVVGEDPLGVTHYYTGQDTSAWLRDVPTFASVRLVGLHEGIDVVVYAVEGGFEFDHVVAPGAEPGRIRLRIEGAEPHLAADGSLQLGHAGPRLGAPIAYQGGDSVPVAFHVEGREVTYGLGAYDASLSLVIDPTIKYSSYLGASGTDYLQAVRVIDPPAPFPPDQRVVYVAGHVSSGSTYPSGFGTTLLHGVSSTGYQGIVARLVYDLSTREMSTDWVAYYGGTGTEYLYGLDVLEDGTVAVTGYTYSTDLPLADPVLLMDPSGSTVLYDGSVRTGTNADIFVATLDGTGALLFSTYLGGGGTDYGRGVALDGAGHVVVAGYNSGPATTPPFPTTPGAYQPAPVGTLSEVVVARIDTTTSPASLVFSTFIGGGNSDYAYGVDVDSSGVYVVGEAYYNAVSCAVLATYCVPYPTTPGAFQTVPVGPGTATLYMGFLTKLSPTGDGLVYSTYLDGTAIDEATSVAVVPGGSAWVAGHTSSTDFPVCPAYCGATPAQATKSGGTDTFLVRMAPDGSSMEYGSFLGSSGTDTSGALRPAPDGSVVAFLQTSGTGLPVVGATFPTKPGGTDTYMARIDPASGITLATWLGGTGVDNAYGADVDDVGNIYLAGMTTSTGATGTFPLVFPVQGTAAGGGEGYLTVFGKAPPVAIITADTALLPAVSTPVLMPAGHYLPVATPYQPVTMQAVTLDGSSSLDGDYPRDPSLDEWRLYDGATLLATETGVTVPSFSPLDFSTPTERKVCLTVHDTDPIPGAYDTSSTSCLDIKWLNQPPVAAFTPTPDAVQLGASIAFVDASTDPEGTPLSYDWDFGDGSTSALPEPVRVYAAAGTYTVSLTVTDAHGGTDTATETVEVVLGPVADFAPDAPPHVPGATITFTDTSQAGSEPIQARVWDFGDGATAVYGDAAPATVQHAYATPGVYVVTLNVTDGNHSHAKSLPIVVAPRAPVPGADTYTARQYEALDVPAPGLLGNDVSPDGLALQAQGATAPAHGSVTCAGIPGVCADGSFTYTPTGAYVGPDAFTYEVFDGVQAVTVPVVVKVATSPPPTASIGVRMHGLSMRLSDLSVPGYAPVVDRTWTVPGIGTFHGTSPVVDFPAAGTYNVGLTVEDAFGLTGTAYVVVYAAAAPVQPEPFSDAPVAVAGADRKVTEGASVVLDGGGSLGASLRFAWQQTGGPMVGLSGHDQVRPVFTAPAVTEAGPAVLVFSLRVYDGHRWSTADEVRITVEDAAHRPTASVVMPVQSVRAGETVVLEGVGSDPDGDAVTHRWKQVAGSAVHLQGTAEPTVSFTAPRDGVLRFVYAVSDGTSQATAEAVVEVIPRGPVATFTALPRDAPGLWAFQAETRGMQYEWDFGDGSPPSHLAAPTHRYAESGDHTIRLMVTDAEGRTDLVAREIHVAATALTGLAGSGLETGNADGAATLSGLDPADAGGADAGAAKAHDVPTALHLVVAGLAVVLLVRRRH